MDRINTPTATADRQFTEGSPTGGVPATVVTADWLNDVQEELCNLVTGVGFTLDGADQTQVLKAVQALANVSGGTGQLATSGYVSLPVRPVGGGARVNLKIQWTQMTLPQNVFVGPNQKSGVTGTQYQAGVSWTYPSAFTTAIFFATGLALKQNAVTYGPSSFYQRDAATLSQLIGDMILDNAPGTAGLSVYLLAIGV